LALKVEVKAMISSSQKTHLSAIACQCHMGSHNITCRLTQGNTPALTPASKAGTRFTYPGGMEGWVSYRRTSDASVAVPV